MSSSVFAFVANQSLQDGAEYQSNPPYRPNNKDPNTGEYVPDIGGLALQYPRAQSPMHWGVFGSLSPTLVGGGAYHQMTSTSPGTKCKKGGVVYLDEPTGASKDQATIGGAALKASWGGGLAYNFYHQPLEAQEAQWSTTVQQMISDGVNCRKSRDAVRPIARRPKPVQLPRISGGNRSLRGPIDQRNLV